MVSLGDFAQQGGQVRLEVVALAVEAASTTGALQHQKASLARA